MNQNKRPAIRIRFKYNRDTGEIEEFIIDDSAPGASDEYHDQVARLIAERFAVDPEIIDAGKIRLARAEPGQVEQPSKEEEKEVAKKSTQTD